MNVGRCRGCLRARIPRLGHEAGRQAGQHVTHARSGHTGISRRDQPWGRSAIAHQRAVALEHHGAAIAVGQCRKGTRPVGLYGSGRAAEQPPGLAGVGGQNPVVAPLGIKGQQVQRIRIQHQRLPARARDGERRGQKFPGPVVLPQSGPQSHYRGAAKQRHQVTGADDAVGHQLRTVKRQQRGIVRPGRHAHEACTGPQCRLPRQRDGAAHAVIAADNEDMAEIALVGGHPPRRQQPGEISVGEEL